MKILALDPATLCGWAHSDGMSGTWDLNVARDESTGMRLVRLRAKLNEILNASGVQVLVFEAARNAQPDMQGALVVQSEIQGVIKAWCHEFGIEYRGYSPTEIKKHATGKGNTNKGGMIEAAKVKWPLKFSRPKEELPDDNEVDALWILDFATKTYDIRVNCLECGGTGFDERMKFCLHCEGSGKEPDDR